MFCPKCGSNQWGGQRFCNVCGTNLPAAPHYPHGPIPPQNYAQTPPQFPYGQVPPHHYPQPGPPPLMVDGARRLGRIYGISNCVLGGFMILLGVFSIFFLGAGALCLIVPGLFILFFGILRLVCS
jgi:hypothetical protein